MNEMVTVYLKKIRFLSLLIPWYEMAPFFSIHTQKECCLTFFYCWILDVFGPVIKNVYMIGGIGLNMYKCVCLRQTS